MPIVVIWQAIYFLFPVSRNILLYLIKIHPYRWHLKVKRSKYIISRTFYYTSSHRQKRYSYSSVLKILSLFVFYWKLVHYWEALDSWLTDKRPQASLSFLRSLYTRNENWFRQEERRKLTDRVLARLCCPSARKWTERGKKSLFRFKWSTWREGPKRLACSLCSGILLMIG